MILVLLGKPGAGKGTLCDYALKINKDLYHVSTGDIFRKEIKERTELGLLAESYISKGNLCPDEVTIEIIKKLIKKDPNKDYIFDGFPRTVNQAIAFDEMLKELNLKITSCILIDVTDNEAISRISGRRICKNCGAIYNIYHYKPTKDGVCDKCGGELYIRTDDMVESVKVRLNVYENLTKPIVDYYKKQNLVSTYSGSLKTKELYDSIERNIKATNSLSSQNL